MMADGNKLIVGFILPTFRAEGQVPQQGHLYLAFKLLRELPHQVAPIAQDTFIKGVSNKVSGWPYSIAIFGR